MATTMAKPLYPDRTIHHGTGKVSADSTAQQCMKITGDDEYAPQTDKTLAAGFAGILSEDRLDGEYCTILMGVGDPFELTIVNGSPTADDFLQAGVDGFLTKYTDGEKIAQVISASATTYIVKMLK